MTSIKNKSLYKSVIIVVFLMLFLIFISFSDGTFVVAARKTAKSRTIDLGFERTGRISKIYVKVGDKVAVGQSLAELDRSDLLARLHQAEAALQVQKSELNSLNSTKQNNFSLALDSAKIALESAQEDLVYSLEDAYTKADDAVRDKAGQVFINQKAFNPTPAFSIYDSSLQSSIATKRVLIETVLVAWQDSLNNLAIDSDLESFTNTARANIALIRSFLDAVALAVNLTTDTSVAATTLRNWRGDIFTGRTNINSALRTIVLARAKVKDAQIKVNQEQQKLSLTSKGVAEEQITLLEGRVKEAQAQVEIIKSALSKMILRSPINGKVNRIDARPGLVITGPNPIIYINP